MKISIKMRSTDLTVLLVALVTICVAIESESYSSFYVYMYEKQNYINFLKLMKEITNLFRQLNQVDFSDGQGRVPWKLPRLERAIPLTIEVVPELK